jgi:IS5 family transposase
MHFLGPPQPVLQEICRIPCTFWRSARTSGFGEKGNDWHFGTKAHIGMEAASGLVHTLIGTAGNVSDVTQARALLHGDETAALGDAGYRGEDLARDAIA